MLENPEDYEKHFERIAQKIIDTLGEKNYKETIHSLYNQLT
jgi:hypothetical protein